MNTASQISDDASSSSTGSSKNTTTIVKKKGGGCKPMLFLSGFLALCLLCLTVVLSVSWGAGYLQKGLCGSVLEGSSFYNALNCKDIQKVQNVESTVQDPNSNFPVKTSEEQPTTTGGEFDVARIYENTSKSIVGIGLKGQDFEADQIIGTGFVVSANGLIATNQHVVSDTKASYYVKFQGSEELVDVVKVYRDSVNDIAIVEVSKKDLQALTIGNSENLKPGQPVVAIGNPLGQLSSSVTSGIISGLHREVNLGNSFLRSNVSKFEDTIQTDAAINPGNSGGPLLNAAGHVVGINFATIQGYDNLSFAIPINYLKTRLDELKQFGKFRISYLGIQYRTRLVNVGSEVLVGAQITAIDTKGPASGKLVVGDTVVSFNEVSLENNSLLGLIQKAKIDQEVKLTIINKSGEKKVVTVKIAEKPAA